MEAEQKRKTYAQKKARIGNLCISLVVYDYSLGTSPRVVEIIAHPKASRLLPYDNGILPYAPFFVNGFGRLSSF